MRSVFLILILLFSFSNTGKAEDSLFHKGLENIINEEYQKAQKDFLQDIKEHPSFSAYYNLGIAAGKLENWHKAKWAFETALKYQPLNGDAQYNARFATEKLKENYVWTHPYPWLERLTLGFGTTTWIILVSVTSIIIGLFAFVSVSKTKLSNTIEKWSRRLIVLVVLLFMVSFFGIYSNNQHYNTERFVILKNTNTDFYISPNGVQIKEEINPASRLKLVEYAEDSSWIKVKTQGKNQLWLEKKDVFTY